MLGITLEAADVVSQVDDTWEEATAEQDTKFENEAKEVSLRQQAAGLVAAYLGQVPPDEPRPVAVEATMEVPLVDPVTGEDLGISLLGITDLVVDSEQGPVVADFKTSSRSAPPFEITHDVQLTSTLR